MEIIPSKKCIAMEEPTFEAFFGPKVDLVREALSRKRGAATIEDLVKATALKRGEVYGALGWLDRENKLQVGTRRGKRVFSLRPE
jgi:hypothetical protein